MTQEEHSALAATTYLAHTALELSQCVPEAHLILRLCFGITAPCGNTGPNPNHTFATTLAYNSAANLTQKIDADGNKTTYGYDTLGRQTTTVDPDGYATGEVRRPHLDHGVQRQ